jgi:hypothetical protein
VPTLLAPHSDKANEDGAKMVAGRVDTKPDEAIFNNRYADKYWFVSFDKTG